MNESITRPIRKDSRGVTIARIALGAVFALSGASGFVFLFVAPPPPAPGLAALFTQVFFASHWVQFVDGVELICGIGLLANRYVPLALVTLAGVIANMFWFHLSMQPIGLIAPIVLGTLWYVVARSRRASLSPLLDP